MGFIGYTLRKSNGSRIEPCVTPHVMVADNMCPSPCVVNNKAAFFNKQC